MSSQLEFLKNIIASAQTGNEAAIRLLRNICFAAMEKAPMSDLIVIANCLYHVGIEAERIQIRKN